MIQFEQTNNAATVRARVLEQVAQGRTSRLLANLDTVTENVYRSLPSGDYGRGDVRRVIQDTIDAHGKNAAETAAQEPTQEPAQDTDTRKSTATYQNEKRICAQIIDGLLAAGYVVTIDDGEEESAPVSNAAQGIEFASWDDTARGRVLWNLDDFYIRARKDGAKTSFVWLIVSNGNDGLDVVSDYGLSLESIVDPILAQNQ